MHRSRDAERLPTIQLRAFIEDLLMELDLAPRAPRVQLDALVFPATIKADASSLRRVLSNLLRASLRRAPPATSVGLVVSPRGRHIEFRIADQGVEVGAAEFEPSPRNARSPNDPSGMAFSAAEIEENGGRLTVTKTQAGTVACLSFPNAVVELGQAGVSGEDDDVGTPRLARFKSGTYPLAAQQAIAATRHTVLVVDDEPLIRKFVQRALRDAGYGTLEASCAESAYELLQARGQGISLLLTDVGLPGASGAELVQKAGALLPSLPALLMSASSAALLASQGVLRADTDLLQKPFEVPELLSRVERELSRAAARTPSRALG